MKRYLDDRVQADLAPKMVFLTGPRQVGKTTLSRQLIAEQGGQYLNYDVPGDRTIILHRRWNPLARLLVLNEINKMPETTPHRALKRFAREQPQAKAVQVRRHLPHSHALGEIQIMRADEYLSGLRA